MLSGDLNGKEIQKRGNICICMGFLSGSTGKESACNRGFPGCSDGKESACNSGDPGSIHRSGRFPWRRKWQLTPVFLPGEFHGQRSLAGYSPWGRRELDMTKLLTLSACNARDCLQGRRPGLGPWVGKIPWRRKWQPTPVSLPGKSHGQRSLMGCKELDVDLANKPPPHIRISDSLCCTAKTNMTL